jgi:putative DNA primase/helicase
MTLHGYENFPVIEQFKAAMARRGLMPPKQFVADGKLHRCNTKAKNGRGDGSYLLHIDGTIPAGGFQNWQDGLGWEDWRFDPGREPTAAERDEFRRKSASVAKARDETNGRDQAKASEKAQRLAKAATQCLSHAYLQWKNVSAHGACLLYGRLVVPMCDADGVIQNLQFIHGDGTKRYLRGGRVKGCFHRIPGSVSGKICIAEGFATSVTISEATGYTTIIAFDAGNLQSVAEAIAKTADCAEIIICADDDWKRKGGNIGIEKSTEAARAVGAKLAIPNFGINRRDKDKDFNDLANFIGPEAVKRCIDAATVPDPAPESIDHNTEIERLVKLDAIEYDREREKAAERLGVRVGTLDDEVKKRRQASRGESDESPHWRVEPWGDPVDGATLLAEIADIFSRYVVLPRHAATVLALWVMHTWCIDASDISPYLIVNSPEKRCGKTTVLIILLFVTRRSELASNISPAAIFRYIEREKPALLIDEADSFLKGNNELRGILNSGHTRAAAYVIRTVEISGDHVAKRFSTWAPKAIAAIGNLADTLADRSITINMQRKRGDQHVERLRRRDNAEFAQLRRMALRWVNDNTEALSAGGRQLAPVVRHRRPRRWDWPNLARAAALVLSGVDEPNSLSTLILADIRAAFRPGESEAATKVLIDRLTADPERPWADYRKGKPITDRQLAALLKPFGITSETVHPPGQPDAKGYRRTRFEEAWSLYLPAENDNSDVSKPPAREGSRDASEGADAGRSPGSAQSAASETSKRPSGCGTGTSEDSRSVQEVPSERIENCDLSYSRSGLDGWTGRKPGDAGGGNRDSEDAPALAEEQGSWTL